MSSLSYFRIILPLGNIVLFQTIVAVVSSHWQHLSNLNLRLATPTKNALLLDEIARVIAFLKGIKGRVQPREV